jgi:hypothetical protein
MVLKQGRNRGLLGPKRSLSCQFHQIVCFQWSYLGCMTQKQGSNWGYRAQNGVIIGLYGPKTGSKLGFLGPICCQSCQIHQNFVFSVVIIGLYDFKTVSILGKLGPKRGHNWVVVPLTLNHGQIWVISPKTGS